MAEAASGWDGRLLVRPRVEYVSVWDADILYGCVCDPGWIGHDCSQLECPRGDDPLTLVRFDPFLPSFPPSFISSSLPPFLLSWGKIEFSPNTCWVNT